MDNIEHIIKIIGDYGVMIIISGIFIYAVVKVINLAIDWAKSKMNKTSHEDNIKKRVDVGEQIHKLIAQQLRQLDLERIQVIEFSNSVVSVAYLPFRYMTCTYEVYDLDRSPTGYKLDRISTSLFSPFFTKLQENPIYLFEVSDELDPSARSLSALMDADRYVACIALRTAKGKMIGYIQATQGLPFTDESQLELRLVSAQVAELLGVMDQ